MHTYMNNRNKHTLGAYSEESTNRKIFIHAKAHNKDHPLHTVQYILYVHTYVRMYVYIHAPHPHKYVVNDAVLVVLCCERRAVLTQK